MASPLPASLLCMAAIVLAAIPAESGIRPAAAGSYVDGLDALNEGRWRDAASAFTKALETAADNPDSLLARGVAATLAEDFSNALNDLQRAQRLGYRGREPELWLSVAEAMSGTVISPDHALGGGPRGVPSGPVVVLLPGHLAQGQDEYTTEYGSFILYELGQAYQDHRVAAAKGGTKSPEMRQAMLKAGQLFAENNYRRPELASISTARAKQASDGNATPKNSMAHVARALAGAPGDPDTHYQAGKLWLEAGRPVSARKEFTIALTFKTDLSDAYLGRATAAARMGDEQRMAADLDIYKKLGGWFATRSARSAVESELSTHAVRGSADKYVNELQDAAASGKPLEHLVAIATSVHRAKGPQRLRYDELYQDRLRILDDAVRENPKNPDKLVDLATYFIEEAEVRGEKVEPRRALEPYRFQVSRKQELQRGIRIAEQALAMNPKHVGAMMQKAIALTGLGELNQADQLADQALNVSGSNPDALSLYAKFRAMRANQMSNEAWNLRQERCTSSTSENRRSDGITEVVKKTSCIQPSQADLQRADQLDAAAAEFRRRARAAMEKAISVTKGTAEGLLLQADLALWDGKTDQAQGAFEQAVKLNPKSLVAQQRLVQHYARTGQLQQAEEQQLIFANLFQTTAAPLLRLTWRNTEKAVWQAGKGSLARATRTDPEDARIPAYLGVIAEAEGKTEEAVAHYRAALALEEARLQLDEQKPEAGRVLGRDAFEFGLATQARFHLARRLQKTGSLQEALTHYQAVLDYEKRMSSGFESREMFNALWPDQQPEGGALVVGPTNAATLVAEAHLQTGKILSAMGKHDESIEHLRTAAMFGPLKMADRPKLGDGYGHTNFGGVAGVPAQEAQILLAKELIAKGDAQGARAVLFEAGNGAPDHLRKEINDINMAMLRLPPPPYHDPYADTKEEQARIEELKSQQERRLREQTERNTQQQAQRDRTLARRAVAGLPPLATVVPSLVGRWKMVPDNPSAQERRLTIGRDSRYTLVTPGDGSTRSGTAYLQGKRQGRRNTTDPSNGQILLYDDQSGQVGSMWFELTGDGAVQLTGASGTRYTTTRE